MATAGTVVLEAKIAVDIVLAEDGKYYVELSHDDGRGHRAWMSRRSIRDRGQGARLREMAELHSDVREACATSRPVAVLNLFDPSDGSPKGPRTQQSVNVYPAAAEVGSSLWAAARGGP